MGRAPAALASPTSSSPALREAPNLAEQKLILPGGRAIEFPVDSFARHCLLEGVDELGYILQQEASINTLAQA